MSSSSASQVSLVCSASEQIKKRLLHVPSSRRIPLGAGDGEKTIDSLLGGLPGEGLVLFVGAVAGFRTGVISSLVANQVLDSFIRGEQPPVIWGHVGEESADGYTRRIITNIMNRDPLLNTLGHGPFAVRDVAGRMAADEGFNQDAISLIDSLLPGCFWLESSAEKDGETSRYQLLPILEAFDRMLQDGVRPRFIIMDSITLLKLPSDSMSFCQESEFATIAHILDEWSRLRGITIVTSAQVTEESFAARRNLRFYTAGDLGDGRGIVSFCRMVVSLMPFTETLSERPGASRRGLALKVMKNCDGPKDYIFTSTLDEATNIALADSRYWQPGDWQRQRENILSKKDEVWGLGGPGAKTSSATEGTTAAPLPLERGLSRQTPARPVSSFAQGLWRRVFQRR